MVFSSITFLLYFFPIVLLAYYVAPCRLKNIILLVSSLFFYAWGEPVYVFLMMFSICVNYLIGRAMNRAGKKILLAGAVAVNIGLLGFFKYADFLIYNVNSIFSLNVEALELPLPIGISFYTFQALSYIIDLYRGNVKEQRNIIDFGMYVALFPQLIAGPIVRLKTIENQLHRRPADIQQFSDGIKRFVAGLAKKVLLANNIGLVWNNISAANVQELPAATAWVGIAAFTFQIYFDFSGYSDMAIGLGKMFGFNFDENFNYPYTSKSITQFWRCWHISLSTWFKEYVYIPLGGNKKGPWKQIRNILIVWMLTGLWHGASWNFVLWGAYFGVLLILEKFLLGRWLDKLPKAICHIYTMMLVMISWAIFAITDFSQLIAYLGAMLGSFGAGMVNDQTLYILGNNWLLFVLLILGSTPGPKKFAAWLIAKAAKREPLGLILQNAGILVLLLLSVAYIVSSSYNPFLYFRF